MRTSNFLSSNYLRKSFILIYLSISYYKDPVFFTTQMPDTNDTSATRVKNFDFDNDTNSNIFSHPYIYYMTSTRFQGEQQSPSKNYILEMPCSHAKRRLKSAPQKLNFLMAKALLKRFKLDYSCKSPSTFSHNYTL